MCEGPTFGSMGGVVFLKKPLIFVLKMPRSDALKVQCFSSIFKKNHVNEALVKERHGFLLILLENHDFNTFSYGSHGFGAHEGSLCQ